MNPPQVYFEFLSLPTVVVFGRSELLPVSHVTVRANTGTLRAFCTGASFLFFTVSTVFSHLHGIYSTLDCKIGLVADHFAQL